MNNTVEKINNEQLSRAIMLCWKARIPLIAVGGTSTGKTTTVLETVARLNESIEDESKRCKVYHHTGAGLQPEDIALPRVIEESVVPQQRIDALIEKLSGKKSVDNLNDRADLLAVLKGEKNGTSRTVWAPSIEDFPFDSDEFSFVFLDEIDRTQDKRMQNLLMRLLLERQLHGHAISPNAYFCGAMNGISDIYTMPLAEAAISRCAFVYMSNSADGSRESYQDWAARNHVHPIIRAFQQYNPVEDPDDFEELSVDKRRTRDFAGRLFTAASQVKFKSDDIMFPLLCGLMSKKVAIDLMAFADVYFAMPDPKTVLLSPDTARLPDEHGVLYAVNCALVEVCDTLDDARAAMRYFARQPGECAKYQSEMLTQKFDKLAGTREFQAWYDANEAVLL